MATKTICDICRVEQSITNGAWRRVEIGRMTNTLGSVTFPLIYDVCEDCYTNKLMPLFKGP